MTMTPENKIGYLKQAILKMDALEYRIYSALILHDHIYVENSATKLGALTIAGAEDISQAYIIDNLARKDYLEQDCEGNVYALIKQDI